VRFYLTVHEPSWLWDPRTVGVPLFLSHQRLRRRRTPFPRATTRWALDSGGFSELDRHHRFETTPAEYVAAARRYRDELGSMDWAAPQDWMCEPWMIQKTGLTVLEHQLRTVQNFLELTTLAPDVPWVPVIQGWELEDYRACVEIYEAVGIDLTAYPLVGVGSVCRRQDTDEIGEVFGSLAGDGLAMHGFGVKGDGIARYGEHLASADSMAWSSRARWRGPHPSCPGRAHCGNCLHFALEWRERLLARKSFELSA
jgi:hypothetical protein